LEAIQNNDQTRIQKSAGMGRGMEKLPEDIMIQGKKKCLRSGRPRQSISGNRGGKKRTLRPLHQQIFVY
jgi:hypothetical protein